MQTDKKIELKLSHAEWGDAWWSINDVKLYVFRAVRIHDGGPACGEGETATACMSVASLEVAVLYPLENRFEVLEIFGVGGFDKELEFKQAKSIKRRTKIFSEDGSKLIYWKDDFRKIKLLDIKSGLERVFFTKLVGNFVSSISITIHAWAPDNKKFVVGFIKGGIFGMFKKWHIYIIDWDNLKRK